MHSLIYSLRRLSREPGFVATALGLLAVCLAANLMIFAVLDSLLLKPLPFANSERLYAVYNGYPNAGLPRASASVRDYFTRRQGQVAAFEAVSAYRYGSEPVASAGQVTRQSVMRITPDFFDTLGVRLSSGRAFSEGEMEPGAQQSVIISERYRELAFGNESALGRRIDIGGTLRTVVGVLPAGYRFLSSKADLYLPLVSTDEQRALNALHGEKADMLVRLREGATADQALQQLNAHYAIQSQGYPWAKEVEQAGFAIHVVNLHDDHIADARPVVLLLQAGALGLLLVGLANLLNLLLLRHLSVQTHLSIRRALGAGRGDLIKPVLMEILLLCLSGSAIAWLLARAGLQFWASEQLPLGAELGGSDQLLAVSLLAGLTLTVILGAVFALLGSREPAALGASGANRSRSDDRRTLLLRRQFAIFQLSLAFVLLAGASALGLGLQAARSSDPGFDPAHSVAAALDLPDTRYENGAARLAFAQRAIQRLSEQSGISSVGFSTNLPVRGRGSFNDRQAIHVIGYVPQPGRSPLLHNRYGIAGDYFQSLGITLREGRLLDQRDLDGSTRAVVVDQEFADFYWPKGEAVGQRLFNGPDPQGFDEAYTVVGVVNSVRQEEVNASSGNGTLYLPYTQLPHAEVYVTVRSQSALEPVVATLRSELSAIDPALALDDVRPMQARIDDTLSAHRAPAMLSGLFALAALLLAAVGTFGQLAYAVNQSRREIGMRIALGARPAQITRRYLGFGMKVLSLGALFGGIASVGLLYLLTHYLPEVPAADVSAVTVSALVLAVVVIAACLTPAIRAARTSPMAVLGDL